jgi:hypothetical protein
MYWLQDGNFSGISTLYVLNEAFPKFSEPFISAAVPFPFLLTFFLEPQIKLPVEMHPFIAHIVMVCAQVAPASFPIGDLSVDSSEDVMDVQGCCRSAHITSAVIAHD